jgi:hypothetical protein
VSYNEKQVAELRARLTKAVAALREIADTPEWQRIYGGRAHAIASAYFEETKQP